MMNKVLISAICLVIGIASTGEAAVGRFDQFLSDVDSAYAAYRTALFQTNKGDAAASEQANEAFAQAWEGVIAAYDEQPPEPFGSDPDWLATLLAIKAIAARSAEEIRAGDLGRAHETLEAIRDELGALRKRNHVIVFSDHVNDYHEVMEELLLLEKPAKNPDLVRERLAVLRYLAGVIRAAAPPEYRADETYAALERGLFDSLEALRRALAGGDPAAVAKAVRGLKPAYAKLFLKFG